MCPWHVLLHNRSPTFALAYVLDVQQLYKYNVGVHMFKYRHDMFV